MQTELFSISKVFTESIFRIPDYQRGYSWSDLQLKDFWNDVEQLEGNRNHYTGVLTFEEVPESIFSKWEDDLWIVRSRGYRPYFVVDGQQRLTTILIAIQAILELFPQDEMLNYTQISDIRRKFIRDSKDRGISHSYVFGYEKDNPSYEFLKTAIFKEQSDKHFSHEDTIYTHNLANAKKFFAERFKNQPKNKLEIFYTKLTQQLLFNIYTIAGDIDVCVTFETMNNRGKPLSHLELLKNRLIYLSTRFRCEESDRAALRSTINESWKSLYHFLGKNKLRPLSDDVFLHTHFLLRFGPALAKRENDPDGYHHWKYPRDGYYQRFLLDQVFSARRIVFSDEHQLGELTIKEVYDYAQDIKKVVQTFFKTLNPSLSSLSADEKVWLERLRRLNLSHSPAFLVGVYLTEKNASSRIDLLKLFEQILFIEQISPYISGLERLDYDVIGMRLVSGETCLQEVIQKLTEFRETVFKKLDFSRVFADWGKGRGYYAWRGARYFLFEYEQHLKEKSKTKREKLSWEEFFSEDFDFDYNTLEHIYPQKIEFECWKKPYAQFTVKQRNTLKNSIGNLVPLSRPKNASLRNRCFQDKKQGTRDDNATTGYAYGCYSELEIAQENEWTAIQILTRGIKLLDFMEQRWGIPLGERTNKVKALGLEFVAKRSPDRPEEPA